MLNDYLQAFEQETGHPASGAAVRVAEWLNDVGKKFSAIGFGDGNNAQDPLPDSIFEEFAKNNFSDDPEMIANCADYVRGCYYEGFEAGQVVG